MPTLEELPSLVDAELTTRIALLLKIQGLIEGGIAQVESAERLANAYHLIVAR